MEDTGVDSNIDIITYLQKMMTVAYLCTSSTPDSCVYISSLEPYTYL